MGFVDAFLGIFGFGIGIPIGLLVGFFFFIYSKPDDVQDPIDKTFYELDKNDLVDLLHEIPLWAKNPYYDRVDWLNKLISIMWPFLDKAICSSIRRAAEPMFAEYIGSYKIESIDFESLSLGTLPPKIYGLKTHQTNEKELIMEPAIRWASNPNLVLVLKVLSLRITVQLVDLQIFAAPRVTLKPLVPTFPCFTKVFVCLMEKPHVDFGMKIQGGDIMAIPGLYGFVQDTIKKQVASLYLWPQFLEIPILDDSACSIKKPVGILHVKVVRAQKLLKMDILGTSDPYVKLSLTGERLPAKKTTIKRRNLNPEWNENFKLLVKDPKSQVLQLQVYDWDKVGSHDRLGVQIIPLKVLVAYEMKEFTLDLVKSTNGTHPRDKKRRGRITMELTFVPFKEDNCSFREQLDGYGRKESGTDRASDEDETSSGAGLLSVLVQGAEDVQGQQQCNRYALIHFRGEKKKTKMMKRTRDPLWNEEFQFMLEEPPRRDKIHIEVISKGTGLSFRSKVLCCVAQESLGHVEINLMDVVLNGRINRKYHLINSKKGMIHLDIQWKIV